MGGLSGSGAFALAVLLHTLPSSLIREANHTDLLTLILNLALATAEGTVWGLIVGVGTIWALSSQRPRWQTLSVVAVACGLVLALAESIGHAFRYPQPIGFFDPPFWIMVVAGALTPLGVLAAALLAGKES